MSIDRSIGFPFLAALRNVPFMAAGADEGDRAGAIELGQVVDGDADALGAGQRLGVALPVGFEDGCHSDFVGLHFGLPIAL